MDRDLILVIGIVVVCLSIPSMLSAFSDSRAPKCAAFLLLAGAALIGFAVMQKPSGYALAEVPEAFYGVIGRILN